MDRDPGPSLAALGSYPIRRRPRFAAMTAKSNAPRSLSASVSRRRPTGFLRPIYAPEPWRILRDCEPARIPISAVRPASRRQPSKVAVFVDFLAELLAE